MECLAAKHEIDIDNPEHIREYYALLFRNQKQDKKALTSAIENRDYPEVSAQYRLIDQKGVKVIVPWEGGGAAYEEIVGAATKEGMTGALMRKAAPITVTVFQKELEIFAESIPLPRNRDGQIRDSGYYYLRPQYLDRYDERMGLQISEQEKMGSIW